MLGIESLVVVALCAAAADARPPDPHALVQRSDDAHRVPAERTRMTLELQEKGGPVRVRTVVFAKASQSDQGDRQWIRFEEPADVRGTQLLSIDRPEGGSDQWLYLPAFKKTRRIGAAELGDRFANTDFSYEDLKGRTVDDYSYVLRGSEAVDGADCWRIEATPTTERAKKESPYGMSTLWLRKDNLFLVRLRHVDRKGKPFKEIKFENLVKVGGDAWRADRIVVIDVQRNHRTVATVTAREVLKTLPPETFNPHTLADR